MYLKIMMIIDFAANPDVTVHKITDDHEFIFLACDGEIVLL